MDRAPSYAIATFLEIKGTQVDLDGLKAMLNDLLVADNVEDGAELTLLLAGDERIRALNREHRDLDEPTDVLSFPADEGDPFPADEDEPRYLGDIAVSLETVRRNAEELALAFELELRHVVLHGALHLLGYDHVEPQDEAKMRAREEAVLGDTIHAADRAHDD